MAYLLCTRSTVSFMCSGALRRIATWMRRITSTPSSASTSPLTSAVKAPLLASIWRASSAPPKVPIHSTGGCRNDVVDGGGVRLLEFCGVNFVMVSDGGIDAEDFGFGLAGQVRDGQGPLAGLHMAFSNSNDITLAPPRTQTCPCKFQSVD